MAQVVAVQENCELIFWNPPDANEQHVRPTVAFTREQLRSVGLPDRYAEAIKDSSAFAMTANQLKTRTTDAKWFKKDHDSCIQVEQIAATSDHESAKLDRTIIGVWKLTPSGPKQIRGYDPKADEMVKLEFFSAKTNYTYSDIGQIIQNVLTIEGLGVHSPRKAGGIYFVPKDDQCRQLLDKIDAFSSGVGVSLVRVPLPDTAAAREAAAQAVGGSMEDEVAEHEKCVGKYSADTRADVFTHRRALINSTAVLLVRLGSVLQGRAAPLGERLDALLEKMKALESQASIATQSFGRKVLVARSA